MGAVGKGRQLKKELKGLRQLGELGDVGRK